MAAVVVKTQTAQPSPAGGLAERQPEEISEQALPNLSFEDWLENPICGTEWIDGTLTKKEGITLLHSKVQSKLSGLWHIYKDERMFENSPKPEI